MRSVAHFKRAAVALDGLAEFGAVNCDKAHTLCSKLGIKSFPKFLLFSPRFEWSEEYPKDRLKELGKPKDAMGDDIVEWVRLMLPPFVPGHAVMLDATASSGATASSEAPPAAEASGGRAALLAWEGVWVLLCVAGHDPARCAACNDAKPNLLREPPRHRRLTRLLSSKSGRLSFQECQQNVVADRACVRAVRARGCACCPGGDHRLHRRRDGRRLPRAG